MEDQDLNTTPTETTTETVERRKQGLSLRLTTRASQTIEHIRSLLAKRAVGDMPQEMGSALAVRVPITELVERALDHYASLIEKSWILLPEDVRDALDEVCKREQCSGAPRYLCAIQHLLRASEPERFGKKAEAHIAYIMQSGNYPATADGRRRAIDDIIGGHAEALRNAEEEASRPKKSGKR